MYRGHQQDVRRQAASRTPKTMATTSITREEAKQDLVQLLQTLESVHPDLLANVNHHEYLQLKTGIDSWLPESERVDISDLALIAAEIAAFFKDGHTSVFLSPRLVDPASTKKCMLPFRIGVSSGELIVEEPLPDLKSLEGMVIEKIQGEDAREFLGPMLRRVSGERCEYKLQAFVRNQRSHFALSGLFNRDEVQLLVRTLGGPSRAVDVPLVTVADYDRNVGPVTESPSQNGYTFLQEDKVCHYVYDQFVDSESERKMIDDLFRELNERTTKVLVLDLRNNWGGNSLAGDYLLSYLTDKPYRQSERVVLKLAKERFEAGEADDGLRDLEGLLVTIPLPLQKPETRATMFRGPLVVLTSVRTFSAAASFAATVKDFGLGLLIGEETGGLRQCFMDQFPFKLANSKIHCGVSFKISYAPVPAPDDPYRGTLPDVEVTPELLSKHIKSEDPALSFALSEIQERGWL